MLVGWPFFIAVRLVNAGFHIRSMNSPDRYVAGVFKNVFQT